jgi:tetratricopeptide (TPR) repeat protein
MKVAFASAIALFCAVVGLQAVHEARGGPPASTTASLLYIRSPEAMKRLSLSYDALMADTYWIRTVQYYGGTRLARDPGRQYELLYPLLDLTTSLDPRLNVAYYFGSIFLAEPPPGGPGRPDLAIALLQKGLQAQPERWEFVQAIGFVHYWTRHDYTEAAAWFQRAAEFPNAPIWLAPLAATTLAEGGNRASSRLLWQQVAKTADLEWFRKEAQRRLLQLDAMDQMDRLQEFVKRSGYLPRVADPTGVPYVLDRGVVTVDRSSPLFPLPIESAAR